MIVCVTANAAIDRTYAVPGYTDGGVFRPPDYVVAAGGKGINVARAVRCLGGESICAGFLGGHTGRFLAELAENEGLASRWTFLAAGETRTCIIVTDPDARRTTVVNESGPTVTAADWERMGDDIASAAQTARFVAFSGSLPPGSPLDSFTNTMTRLRSLGVEVWVDTSGKPLEAAAAVRGLPIKINDHEIAALLGITINTPQEAAEAGVKLCSRIDAPVAVTLGRHGAVLADETGCWYARPPEIASASAVGSGDSFLAGLLVALERGQPSSEALRHAAAAGTANALTLGGGNFTQAEFADVLARTTVISM